MGWRARCRALQRLTITKSNGNKARRLQAGEASDRGMDDGTQETQAPQPLVVTLALDSDSQARLEGERRRYFPRRLNRVPAHVSLFHALPSEQEASVRTKLGETTARQAAFAVEINALMQLGRGVAYKLQADPLHRLHEELRSAWLAWLTVQDRQGFRPHVVVQNKVLPEEAAALYARLEKGFVPWQATAIGLLLWRYLGGPWSAAGEFSFATCETAG